MRGASSTTKYWIWVVTAFNFAFPMGALIDRVWAVHLTWARPIGSIGGPIWDITAAPWVTVLAAIWISGTFAMLTRLTWLIVRDCREHRIDLRYQNESTNFVASGIPVTFDSRHHEPAVDGIIWPHIFLPLGIDRLLDEREFDAVLLHELAHARRRDNLIRLIYEVLLSVLWFHPLIWLAGARIALYRELSCDESVIRRAQGPALVSALAKLARPEPRVFLQATASSHLSDRLGQLAGSHDAVRRTTLNMLVALLGKRCAYCLVRGFLFITAKLDEAEAPLASVGLTGSFSRAFPVEHVGASESDPVFASFSAFTPR